MKCKELELKSENKTTVRPCFQKEKAVTSRRINLSRGQRFHEQKPAFKCYHCHKRRPR